MKHYIGMTGLHGYSPSACEAFPTKDQAVEFLGEIIGLGKDRRRKLKAEMYLELNYRPENPILPDDGNEYCEIRKCECETPEIHCDSGEFHAE